MSLSKVLYYANVLPNICRAKEGNRKVGGGHGGRIIINDDDNCGKITTR